MEIGITVAVIIGVIMLGVLVIHRLNAQRDERITVFRYSDTQSGPGGRGTKPKRWRPTGGSSDASGRREHRDGPTG
ncbi:hypothetical protein [Streptomyces radiopugnans]|uniref:Uncharacterized protein n=1 Tax=Streptomyces radiopugnans TaxID=403935 RepID=A0A1H9CVC3_9ACTN|nr:hypothetical protein [Streptomyces radiopugnans]SEQ04528.1 hypothetical protein SAMN05216481_103429 [Streptomyces radiopugnans]